MLALPLVILLLLFLFQPVIQAWQKERFGLVVFLLFLYYCVGYGIYKWVMMG